MARYNQKQFATVTLEKADEKKLVEWAEGNSVTGISSLQDLTADGYKISIAWVDSNQSFCCSLIGTEVSKPNRDAILTSWSDDLEEALVMSAYKHFVVCDGGEWPVNDQSSRWG